MKMADVLRLVVSLSFSGALLIIVLRLLGHFWGARLSKRWQYYMYLVVIAHLLFVFMPVDSLVRSLFAQPSGDLPVVVPHRADWAVFGGDGLGQRVQVHFALGDALQYLWVVWLAVAVLLLVRKLTLYQSFARFIRAGKEMVADVARLDRLSQISAEMGIKRPVELYRHALVSTPLLLGFFRPAIVLPGLELPDDYFALAIRHELVHYKRRDMVYQWLVQICVCVHWFNPLVWLMAREVSRLGELSCDEALLRHLPAKERRIYGDTLLYVAAGRGAYKAAQAPLALSEDGKLLKERLAFIVGFPKYSKKTAVVSAVLTIFLLTSAVLAGAAEGHVVPKSGLAKSWTAVSAHFRQETVTVEEAYEAGSVPIFARLFAALPAQAQASWLEKIYQDGQIAFFGAAVGQMDEDALGAALVERIYQDGNVAFFSVLANNWMDEQMIYLWLKRALADERTAFQVVLWEASGRDWEKEALEKKLDAARQAEYAAHGITMKDKAYYYQGQLVNVFLDVRENKSFYTLDMNPLGKISIKVTRNEAGEIQSVRYMSEAEVQALLYDEEDEQETIIPIDVAGLADGEYTCLGTYDLAHGDRISYHLLAEGDGRLTIGFAKSGKDNRQTDYFAILHDRIDNGQSFVSATTGSCQPPIEAGRYQLFVRSNCGALSQVSGRACIIKAGNAL